MAKVWTFICAAALAGALSGCATPPSAEELARLDYGAYPENYEQIIRAYFDRGLKDPSSLQISGGIPAPTQSWQKFMGSLKAGYRTCVTYNAKNSFGAYTGYTTTYFLIKDGRIIDAIENADRLQQTVGWHICS
jgi:hypothetical protein